jgi:transcriptional regulator NrdR family protein
MNCPSCKSENYKVIDSRLKPDGTRWRRYFCRACTERWSTVSTGKEAEPIVRFPAVTPRRLTFAQAKEIMLSDKSTLALAAKYGISHQAVSQVRLGQVYAYIYRQLQEEGHVLASTGGYICDQCRHWSGGSCGFDFPEAGGDFATDCVLYEAA